MAQDGKPPEFLFDPCLSTAIAANGKQRSVVPVRAGPLAPDLLDKMNRYRRAAASSLIRRQGSVGRAKRLDPAFQ
jgi:hypothetical protein